MTNSSDSSYLFPKLTICSLWQNCAMLALKSKEAKYYPTKWELGPYCYLLYQWLIAVSSVTPMPLRCFFIIYAFKDNKTILPYEYLIVLPVPSREGNLWGFKLCMALVSHFELGNTKTILIFNNRIRELWLI